MSALVYNPINVTRRTALIGLAASSAAVGTAALPSVVSASAAVPPDAITMTPKQLEDAMRLAFLVGRMPSWERAEMLQILEARRSHLQQVSA